MPVSTPFTSRNKGMDGEPALAMTVARCCRWVNIKGDWYKASPIWPFSKSDPAQSSGCLPGWVSSDSFCCVLGRISALHDAFKILGYTMINVRHLCQA
jgi:hypothetical protein